MADRVVLEGFIREHFGGRWANGTEIALARTPASALVAERSGDIVGFAFYDVAYLGYLGPMGVREDVRGTGVGALLLLAALEAMVAHGYAYAVIGDVGPTRFYERVCGARLIAP